MDKELVSIGLCVRNGHDYLRGALDSLLAQTYKNFELVISDNASTDGTQAICEEYAKKDSRIRYVRQKENIGSYGNYDFVRKQARGDYFMWAACDDFWDPRFIGMSVAKFREVPGATMVFPNFYAFDDAGNVMKLVQERYFPYPHDLYERVKAYIRYRAQYGKITAIYGLWKKGDPADQISLGESGGDMIYMLRTLLAGYFAPVEEALFFKRGLVQSPVEPGAKKPTLHYLLNLPPDYRYEPLDEWHETRKKVEKSESFRRKLRNFLGSRLQMTKYAYQHTKYIWRDGVLTPGGKVRLLLWVLYAYVRSFGYGYL